MNHHRSSIQTWKRCLALIRRCKSMAELRVIHALFVTHGLSRNTFATSQLLAFCALSGSGDITYASRIFAHFPAVPNSFFYNTLIRAYSERGDPNSALRYFNLMLKNPHVVPAQHTFPFVLISCGKGFLKFEGMKVHCWVLKNGLAFSDGYVQTALMRFYAACCGGKNLTDARKVFDEIPQPDLVQWNVLMSGYVKLGLGCEALDVFREMLVSNVDPDVYCATTAVSACSQLGSLLQGKWMHEYIEKMGMLENSDVFVGTALVDMYAKCGSIDMALHVFEKMPQRNVCSWAAMIGGLAVHGQASAALCCLDGMQARDGLCPDGPTLLGVLNACNHSGLRREGLFLLENMKQKYGVVPRHEHYSCVVDMLCRAGKLDDAMVIIRRMPMKPLASVWGALLHGSRICKNVELAEVAVKELEMLEEEMRVDGYMEDNEDGGVYVQLSNVYLDSHQQASASRMRKIITERGMKKTPGASLIEVEGRADEFVSGDVSHPCIPAIREMLNLIYLDLFKLSSPQSVTRIH